MAKLVTSPSVIEAAGNKPKTIKEFIGRVNTQTQELSIAQMKSPEGWVEPGQCPEFTEYTVVMKGTLKVETHTEELLVKAGQAVITPQNEWVRYSSPFEGGAEYIAVCLPAFSPETVHRDK